ncbi:MAG: fused MFS/spermidine synthase, partial [Bacteroidales bacterium]|nr:fused MFS/spermidine synthase [Bacteroidales bacterium]
TMTLLMGFYFLPEWGIRKSVLLSAILLGLTVILVVVISRKYKAVSAVGIFIIVIMSLASAKSFSDVDKSVKYLYRSEGILGQLAVVETKTGERTRTMYINQVPQTVVNPNQLPASLWKYPHRLAMLASIKKANSKALMIGLGGGSIAMELNKMGFSVDAVELDTRIPELAEKYFGFKPGEIPVYIDDGRHYIRTTDKKYDLVIIDVLNGEVQPHHMFTMESFEEIKQILEPDGMLMINNQGFLLGERGLGARSVYKTLVESGFKVKYFFAGDANNSADIHFIASPADFEIFFDPSEKINACCKNYPVDYMALVISIEVMAEENKLDLSDAVILTDDKPALVALYNYANEVWRTNIIDNVLNNPNAPRITLFN